MSVISGTRRAMKELADGTIRVQIDIDPIYKDQFLAAFRSIDMPVAIAPLVADFEKPKAPKGGPLAKLAGQWCRDPAFHRWLGMDGPSAVDKAVDVIRARCQVVSRADLDNDHEAAERFHALIRIPFMEFMQAQEIE